MKILLDECVNQRLARDFIGHEVSTVDVFKITYTESVADDLKSLKSHERSRILDQIEVQLSHEPNRETRNRKKLIGLVPPWQHVPPVWELRIDEYRAFYDVDEKGTSVVVRAIRHKPENKRTEEIL